MGMDDRSNSIVQDLNAVVKDIEDVSYISTSKFLNLQFCTCTCICKNCSILCTISYITHVHCLVFYVLDIILYDNIAHVSSMCLNSA